MLRHWLTERLFRLADRISALARTVQPASFLCKDCEGTGMQPSGAYTYDGDRLYDGGTTCWRCYGQGLTK